MYRRRPIIRRARRTIGRYTINPTPMIVSVREMDTENGRLVSPEVTSLLY